MENDMENETQNTAHYWISTGEGEPGGYIGGCYETIADAETAAEELGAYFQFTEPDGRHHSFGLDRGLFVRRCRATCTSCHDCTGDAPHEHAPTCSRREESAMKTRAKDPHIRTRTHSWAHPS